MTTRAQWTADVVKLLTDLRSSLQDGIETPGPHEPEWSKDGRRQIAEIDRLIAASGVRDGI